MWPDYSISAVPHPEAVGFLQVEMDTSVLNFGIRPVRPEWPFRVRLLDKGLWGSWIHVFCNFSSLPLSLSLSPSGYRSKPKASDYWPRGRLWPRLLQQWGNVFLVYSFYPPPLLYPYCPWLKAVWLVPSLEWTYGEGGLANRAQKVESMRIMFAVCLLSLYLPAVLNFSAFQSDIIFQDLEKLKSHPAHLAVFLRYIFSQADPGPLVSHNCQSCWSACFCSVERISPPCLISSCI